MRIRWTAPSHVVLGEIRLRTAPLATDLGRINLVRERNRDRRIDIDVGVDAFAAHDAVIDHDCDVVDLQDHGFGVLSAWR